VSLLEALQDVEQAIAQANRLTHVPADSLAVGQIRAVPEGAVRESLANAVAHRDWTHSDPVIVEFVGDTLIVQSPGGFAEGVDPNRLITAPAHTRNPHLADVLRRLRIAEREGIGVDRMFRELVRLGHPQPEIVEFPGPHVRCALIGGQPDVRLLRLVTSLEPPQRFDDLDIVLLIDVLRKAPTVNATGLSQVLQKPPEEAAAALARAHGTLFREHPLVVKTARTERYRHPDYRFGDAAREHLQAQLPYHRHSRAEVIDHVVAFVRRHGQIKNSDYVELFGVSAAYASTVLKELAGGEGGQILRPGRQPNRGRFAHYVAGPGFPGEREP
jgi:ATP-dependent DNA helicase RecG